MKNFLTLIASVICISTQAQNLVLSYNFQDGTAKDLSINGYDGTLFGTSSIVCENHCAAKVGYGTNNYMTVPAAALNGLNDFTLEMHFSFCSFNTTGYTPANVILSASNADCINCFSIAYDKNASAWELFVNGSAHSFTDTLVHASPDGEFLQITRKNGTIYFYHGKQLLGTFSDRTALNVTSIVLGQQQHCAGGCFECGQTMHGSIDYMKVYDYAFNSEAEEDVMSSNVSTLHVFPNPASTSLHIADYQENYSTVIVTDYTGKVVYTTSFNEEINISTLSSGVYFLQLRTNDDVVSERVKFVKQQ